MTNGKILKINPHLIVLFTHTSLNLIKKGLWFFLCYFMKFTYKPIFDYQNIYLLYGSIWKELDTKDHRNWYNIIGRPWSTNCGNRIEWEAFKKGKKGFYYGCLKSDQRKNSGNTVKCQTMFLFDLLWKFYWQTYILHIHINNTFVLVWKI